MFDSCGVQHLLCFGCLGWAWKRCTRVGADDSEHWPLAKADEFLPVPRICRRILAAYEDDLRSPKWEPRSGYGMNHEWIVKRVGYEQTEGRCSPYIIYADHENQEIVLAIRGLNLANADDYQILLDNLPGKQMFDGGFVHHGLLMAAVWLLNKEADTLKKLWVETGSCYRMIFAGHSLGSGIAALTAILVASHGDKLGGVPRSLVQAYAVAPARCVSLNLAIKYADVINSIILQDDFLPRTQTPLEDHFKAFCCMPCFFLLVWMRDVCIPLKRRLEDPRRLHPPGRLYHIIERKFCRIGRFPPKVRTAIPVDRRFEYVILSCNASSDHEIVWIEKEAQKALDVMQSSEATRPPIVQRIKRTDEHGISCSGALERTVRPDAANAALPVVHNESQNVSPVRKVGEGSSKEMNPNERMWDDLIEKLFTCDFRLKHMPELHKQEEVSICA